MQRYERLQGEWLRGELTGADSGRLQWTYMHAYLDDVGRRRFI